MELQNDCEYKYESPCRRNRNCRWIDNTCVKKNSPTTFTKTSKTNILQLNEKLPITSFSNIYSFLKSPNKMTLAELHDNGLYMLMFQKLRKQLDDGESDEIVQLLNALPDESDRWITNKIMSILHYKGWISPKYYDPYGYIYRNIEEIIETLNPELIDYLLKHRHLFDSTVDIIFSTLFALLTYKSNQCEKIILLLDRYLNYIPEIKNIRRILWIANDAIDTISYEVDQSCIDALKNAIKLIKNAKYF